jgi:hypothetical protein
MKAVLSHAAGGPETLILADLPDPVPGPNDVKSGLLVVARGKITIFHAGVCGTVEDWNLHRRTHTCTSVPNSTTSLALMQPSNLSENYVGLPF